MSSIVIAGDTSGSVTLQAPAVAGTTTITLPATSGTLLQSGTTVTEAQGGTGTTVGYNGFKNRIINGGITISQRGVSPTQTGGGDYSVDRFFNYYSGNAYTSVQSTTAPAGFINSLLLTITTASASPTYSFFGHKIEGLNCADLGYGTATASAVTLSFWVRSSVAGIYSLSLSNNDGNRAYAASYTINTANTWEQKSVTIPGDTSGTWLTTNATGIFIRWNMGTGQAGRLISAGSWQAANADGATGSTGANTWANTSGATFYITGVQLEKGSTATSFDVRPYGTELSLCQRYYYRAVNGNTQPITNGFYYSSTDIRGIINFPCTMRISPSLVSSSGTDHFRLQAVGSDDTFDTLLDAGPKSTTSMYLYINSNVSGTAGNAGAILSNNASASLAFNSEL